MMLSLEVSVAKNASCTTKKGLMILKEGHARMCMNVRGSVTGTALSFVDLFFVPVRCAWSDVIAFLVLK